MDEEKWQEAFIEVSHNARQWRNQHRRASLNDIEDMVDRELAQVRTQMVEDIAQASPMADIRHLATQDRAVCPVCGGKVQANGYQRRSLVSQNEQVVKLRRSKAKCRACGTSFFPSG